MDERKQLHDAPQALQVGPPAKNDHVLATAEKDRQATQIGLDIPLVDATLVEPDGWLVAGKLDIPPPPPLERSPLGVGVVVPRMRDEGVASEEALGLRHAEEPRRGGVVADVLEFQLLEADAAEARPRQHQRLPRRAIPDEAGHARGGATRALALERAVERRLHALAPAAQQRHGQDHQLRGHGVATGDHLATMDHLGTPIGDRAHDAQSHPEGHGPPHRPLHGSGARARHGPDGVNREDERLAPSQRHGQDVEGVQLLPVAPGVRVEDVHPADLLEATQEQVGQHHRARDADVVGHGGQTKHDNLAVPEKGQDPQIEGLIEGEPT
mmetsp:Transcript_29919/g.90544  ORF Transcript_29919/g.90544 Transcript_29919/m.90544 type:complete len:326 (+) Transcript_29919:363-1340(+)